MLSSSSWAICKGRLLFSQYRHDCILTFARFFTTHYGYIYKYVLPGIGQSLANIVIKLQITQRHRRWGWLSLTDLPMIGKRFCCEVASFCKHRETAIIVSLSLAYSPTALLSSSIWIFTFNKKKLLMMFPWLSDSYWCYVQNLEGLIVSFYQ